jgi:alkylation response protein AidB-like acyl-CoA dehydrogenase
MPITLYGTEEQNKIRPKLASGEWWCYCLMNQVQDQMLIQEKQKQFYQKTENIPITGQKMWISNAGFCSVFIVFARIGDDKNITFIVENAMTTEFQW